MLALANYYIYPVNIIVRFITRSAVRSLTNKTPFDLIMSTE